MATCGAAAREKEIHLRRETITTSAPANRRMANAPAATFPDSGMFLVQSTGLVRSQWLASLEAAGGEVVGYVPDDAVLLRIRADGIDRILKVPNLQWIGEYQPRFKVHPDIEDWFAAGQNPELRLRILLSARCREADAIAAEGCLSRLAGTVKTSIGRILVGNVARNQLTSLAAHPDVLWIEPAREPHLYDELAAKLVAGDDGQFGTPTLLQQAGYDGSGVTVAVADSGLDRGTPASVHPDLAGRVRAFLPYNLPNAADGHGHGTHVAGIIAGNAATGETDDAGALYGLGVASNAELVVQRIFDDTGGYTLADDFQSLVRDALQAGADIGSNSWGDDTQGHYDLSAVAFDALVRDGDTQTPGDQPYILEFSAGNAGAGRQTIGSPAVAKNVIATGASQSLRTEFFLYGDGPDAMADFSSRGPAADGRIKPDVVAPGTWIASLQSSGATDENAWLPISARYQYQGGTSQSGPQVSGAAAVFVQFYREHFEGTTPSPALVKAALIHAAVNLQDSFGTRPVPNHDEGWGRVDLTRVIDASANFEFLDQTELLESGETWERRLLVGGSGEPLRITLVYTDVPGLPLAIPALVNDLDLEVAGPDGRTYRGNQFAAGESVPDAPSADTLNNVEGVRILHPLPGAYQIRVRGRNVVEDARRDTPAVDQDFALVLSGELPQPGVGVVMLDREAYTTPADVAIRVFDAIAADPENVTVTVSSGTEPGGETVELASSAADEYRGNVSLAEGPADSDGILQVAHGDTITLTYADADPPGIRTATAAVDLRPPLVGSLEVTNRFGKAIVLFQTDEPALATVSYGTPGNLNQSVAESGFPRLRHELELDGLAEGVLYAIAIDVRDIAGNTATDDNAGEGYPVVGPDSATVLLVDAFYEHISLLGLVDIPPPPLSHYTDALEANGVSYDIWEIESRGSPSATDLQPFRMVIWRFPEPSITPPEFTPEEQDTLRTYLENDGSLFLASMDLLTRVEESPFGKEVLQVAAFATDPGAPRAEGFSNEPLMNGVSLMLDYSDFSLFSGQEGGGGDPLFDDFFDFDWSDTFVPTTNAVPILRVPGEEGIVGLKYPRQGLEVPGRLVFLSFPFDAVPATGASPNNRVDFMERVLSFLVPGAEGVGTLALDRLRYTVPSRVGISVADSDLAGQGEIEVRVFTDALPDGKPVTLRETVRPGEFEGFVSLTDPGDEGAQPAEVTLPVTPDEQIRVEYIDASGPRSLQATAAIDVQPPAITGLEIIPDFGRARVRWQTSEPADSLVQFGESRLFNRTAFEPNLKTMHAVNLEGLQTGRQYVGRVLSRDEAGNTAVADNDGAFYHFQPLTPLLPPWSENLDEDPLFGWTVIEKQGFIPEFELAIATEISAWEHGTPANGRESLAHSPPNAWGSNLRGLVTEGADTMLLTPAVELTGGNRAYLHFFQSYDFTVEPSFPLYDVTGEVYITVNNGLDFELVASYSGQSQGWEEAEIDLSPYTGQTIRLGFYFGFVDVLNLDNIVQPGWLIDDLSLVVENVAEGTLEIQSNLFQAEYSIEGPAGGLSGAGPTTRFENQTAGTYTVTFAPVPYYHTPPPASGDLHTDTTLTLTGNYSFTDTNQNQIPDLWEQDVFGGISPERTTQTDTDTDGYTDYQEYTAGTDPLNPTSILVLSHPHIDAESESLVLEWDSAPSRFYRLEQSQNAAQWESASDWIPGDGTLQSIEIPIPDPPASTFYRLQVQP